MMNLEFYGFENNIKPLAPSRFKTEAKIFKIFLIGQFNKVIRNIFFNILSEDAITPMDSYSRDNKIIQILIQGIVNSGEYTLEGIANSLHIPYDVIYDTAIGNNNQISLTLWSKIVDLHMQVRPEVAEILLQKLGELKEKNWKDVSLILNSSH